MADTDIVQVIAEARADAKSLSEFVWKPIDFMVTRRLAPPINTLNFYIDKLENYTAGLDVKLTAANVVIDNKVSQSKAQIDVIVNDARLDSISKTSSIVQIVKDDINSVLNQTIDNASFNIVDSFEIGTTLTKRTDALRHSASGKLYRWGGVLPKVVPANSTPTNSGGFGANAWLEVSDIALRQELSSDTGYRKVANQMAANAYGVPALLTDVKLKTGSPIAIDYFGGYFYGRQGGRFKKSVDGVTWTDVCQTPLGNTPIRLMPTDDGEVLSVDESKVSKSSGWGTSTVTWQTVLTNPSSGLEAPILAWGADGNGSKFIVTHYGAGATGSTQWAKSRYVWISTDMGATWTVRWDTEAEYPDASKNGHIHAACYDPWIDRFWFSEGHGVQGGLRWSDDNGVTWTRLQNDSGLSPAFTVMTPTDFGIVCGTDSEENGIYVMQRASNPEETGVKLYGKWNTTSDRRGLYGFADRGYRDPDTGIVYVGWVSASAEIEPVIMACGSGGASIVYTAPTNTGGDNLMARFISVVAAKGILLGNLITHKDAGAMIAKTSKFNTAVFEDRGNALTQFGSLARGSSFRIGLNSNARGIDNIALGNNANGGNNDNDSNTAAIGKNTRTGGTDAIAIGTGAYAVGTSPVAIGRNSRNTTGHAIAIGDSAETKGNGSIALGQNAISQTYCVSIGRNAGGIAGGDVNSVSIGTDAIASGGSSVAIGYQSESSNQSTAVGFNAKTTSTFASVFGTAATSNQHGVAVGRSANSGAIGSIAIGSSAQTNSATAYGIAIGYEAKANTGQGISIGKSSEARNFGIAVGENTQSLATSGIVIGRNAKTVSGQLNSIAIGKDANAGAATTLAIGADAAATGSKSNAIGHGASAAGANAVAIGNSTTNDRANSVSVGNRDIESTRTGGKIYLTSPNGTSYAIGVGDDGLLSATPV